MTFREYEDKVQIVKGYVSSVEEGPFVTLDSIISEPVNFIKWISKEMSGTLCKELRS